MRIVSIKISALICLLLLSTLVFAQDQPAPLPQAPAPPAIGSIEAALAVEDPTERLAALQKFLKTNIIPEQAQTAREGIVASYAQMAEVQLGENNIDKALADFRKALSVLPEKTSDRFFEETVIRIPLAVSVRGYRNEAIGLARQLENRFAKEAAPLARIGEFYMTVEAPSDAVRALEAALALGSDEARFHRALGAAYRIGLRLDDAVSEYQQAIKLDPHEKRAYYELANLYRAHGAYADAVKLYRKQLEIDPKHTPSYKGLALTFLAQNDEEQASASLTQARDLRGAPEEITQDIYLQTQLAFYYLAQSKLKQARQAAEAALLVEPRYAWARIAAAEVDLAENKFFEAERNLLAAQQYAGFPTLFFTFGKLYLMVEDFDGALEQFAKAFSYSPEKQFTAKLGGTLDVQGDNLKELLSREHQAAIFLAEPPTNEEQFKLIDALVRFNIRLKGLKPPAAGKSGATPAPTPKQLEELEQAADDFIEAERSRRSFRSLHAAQQLAQAGVSPQLAIVLADQAYSLADIATLLEGSIRDYPNYDREGRLRIFRGRALDAKGWALYKAGQNEAAITALSAAAQTYGPLPEGKRALWHLAVAKETAGEMREALELYLAGYEPPSAKSSFDGNRTVLEAIYRKVNGSTEGLDERLRRATETSSPAVAAILAKSAPPPSDLNQSASETSSRAEATSTGPTTAKNEPLLRLSLPSLAAEKDERNSVHRLSAKKSAKAELQPIIPRSDPMFAKPSAPRVVEPPPAETSTEISSTVPAAPETAPSPLPPIVLPELNPSIDFSIPLTPMIDQRELFAPWENFRVTLIEDEQSEPPPPANPDQPKAHTRKRRVTVPD